MEKHEYLENLLHKVCKQMMVSQEDVKGPSRKRRLMDARKIFLITARSNENIEFKPQLLGRVLNRSRVNVHLLIERTEGLIEFDKRFKRLVMSVQENLEVTGFQNIPQL